MAGVRTEAVVAERGIVVVDLEGGTKEQQTSTDLPHDGLDGKVTVGLPLTTSTEPQHDDQVGSAERERASGWLQVGIGVERRERGWGRKIGTRE